MKFLRIMLTCLLFIFLLTMTALMLGIRVHLTDSEGIPRGIYRTLSPPPKVGTLVEICLPDHVDHLHKEQKPMSPHRGCPTGSVPRFMKVVAIGGDVVNVTDQVVKVNGKALPHSASQSQDQEGNQLVRIPRGVYPLEMNQVWLLGLRGKDAWDSRYFGPINRLLIKAERKELIIW